MAFYQHTFPADFKNSEEGNEILKVLGGRLLSSRKNSTAPLFVSKDINGKQIALQKLKGKYVILSFWATWCSPCVAEIPALKEIRKNIPAEKLEMISISYDTNLPALMEGLKKWNMNWTHIYADAGIHAKYGSGALPMLYLIDDKGKIIYVKDKDEKDHVHLTSLKDVLAHVLQ